MLQSNAFNIERPLTHPWELFRKFKDGALKTRTSFREEKGVSIKIVCCGLEHSSHFRDVRFKV